MSQIALISALARNGGIGRGNSLLFRLPEDLQHFKRTTMGCPVVMGRKTWDSIGRPLPGRRNLVVSRNPAWAAEGAERAGSLDDALARVADAPKVFVIGGAQLYAQALPIVGELVLTEIDADAPEADVFFPAFARDAFVAEAGDWQRSTAGPRFRVVTWRRREPVRR